MTSLGTLNEKTSAKYTALLLDEASVPIAASTLDTLTITVYEVASGTILNSRNLQNALNANGVTLTELGVLTWQMDPADSAIVGTLELEKHRVMFIATWGGGSVKQCSHEMQWNVRNLTKLT